MKHLTKLPERWMWAKLETVCHIVLGFAFKSTDFIDKGIPVIKIANVSHGEFTWKQQEYLQNYFLNNYVNFQVTPNTLLLALTRPITDNNVKACLYPLNAPIGLLNQRVAALKPYKGCLQEFLLYFIQSSFFRYQVENGLSETLQPNLSPQNLKKFIIPLPPLNEQRRLVAKIESLKARTARVFESLSTIPALLDQFRQSVLAAAFRGALTADWREQNPDVEPADVLLEKIRVERHRKWKNKQYRNGKDPQKVNYKEAKIIIVENLPDIPNTWTWGSIEELGRVQLGRQRSPKNHSGPYMRPYLRAANVFEDRISTSDILEMNFNPSEYETFKLEPGDILLNEGQSKELVGRPAIYRGEVPGSCFQNTLVRFQAYEGLLPEYALVVFRGYMHNGRFQKIAQWTTNIAHLGASRFAELEFPLPPEAEQIEIVNRVKSLFESINRFKAMYDANLKELEKLDQSILAQAFRGALVPQDPNDEPASVLLERIRTEREKSTGATPKRSKKSTDTSPSQTEKSTGATKTLTNKSTPFKEAIQMELELE